MKLFEGFAYFEKKILKTAQRVACLVFCDFYMGANCFCGNHARDKQVAWHKW